MEKNKQILFVMISMILLLFGCSTNADESMTQKENNDPENNKIIATTVAVTEIMDALEIDLIGVPSTYKELPKRFDGITEVGNPMSPDMELIMSLQPKEVMSVSTLKYDLESVFEDAGIETSYVNLESIDNMYAEILGLGERYDREQQAQAVVSRLDEKIEEIKKAIVDKEKPKVLILMGIPGSYLVATDKSYIGDLVEKVGGMNVFSDSNVEFVASNTEHLQQADADIILRAAHGMPDEVVEMFEKEFKENNIWKHFKAVQENRVYDLEETLFGTTGNLAAPEALDVLYDLFYSQD